MEALACPSCEKPFSADQVNLDLRVAKCLDCNRVFPLETGAKLARPTFVDVREISLPTGFDLEVDEQSTGDWNYRSQETVARTLRLTRRWRSWALLPTFGFAVLWNGFLVVWYVIAFASGDLVAMFFPLIHVVVGLGLTYSVVAGFFNKSLLEVREGVLRVHHGPIPWIQRRVEIHGADIAQIMVRRTSYRVNRRRRYRYRVVALTHEGDERTL
ncbi:MAG: hypothetical protein KC416_14700, partial [Myxococcales bacterium]|nr:hypothetical protein [Myxococcales bacterium]